MNRYHIVKEYIDYYMFRRRLTRAEFCRICEISDKEFTEIQTNNGYNLEVVKKVANYIKVPMEKLYVDLDSDEFKPIIDDYDKERMQDDRSHIFIF